MYKDTITDIFATFVNASKPGEGERVMILLFLLADCYLHL